MNLAIAVIVCSVLSSWFYRELNTVPLQLTTSSNAIAKQYISVRSMFAIKNSSGPLKVQIKNDTPTHLIYTVRSVTEVFLF